MRVDIAWPGWVDKRTAKSLYAGDHFVTLQAFIKASGQVEAARLARPEPIPARTCVLCRSEFGHTQSCGMSVPPDLLALVTDYSNHGGVTQVEFTMRVVDWLKGRM